MHGRAERGAPRQPVGSRLEVHVEPVGLRGGAAMHTARRDARRRELAREELRGGRLQRLGLGLGVGLGVGVGVGLGLGLGLG